MPNKFYKKNRKSRKDTRNLVTDIVNYGPISQPFATGLWRGLPVKNIDIPLNAYPATTSGSDLVLTGSIDRGTSQLNRTGNIIHVLMIDCEYFVNIPDTTNFLYTRLLLCPNGQASAVSYGAVYDLPDADQYVILKQKLTTSTSTALNDTSVVRIRHIFPGRGLMVRFDAGTSSEIYNRLRVSFVSDSSIAPHPTITGNTRVYFQDA